MGPVQECDGVTFGAALRGWREERGFSQLRLASSAEVSQRHISFLENGRAQPSREMVTHLGRVLRMPLSDQNALLLEAGFAPEYSEVPVTDLGDVGAAIQFMLAAHEPNPAIVVDRSWNLLFANGAALAMTAALAPAAPLFEGQLNVLHAMFHPDGFGRHVLNRAELEPMLLWRLADDLDHRPKDEALRRLRTAVGELSSCSPAQMPGHAGLIGTVRLKLPIGDVSFFSCLTRLENAADLTLEELRIETFFPADEESRQSWTSFLATHG